MLNASEKKRRFYIITAIFVICAIIIFMAAVFIASRNKTAYESNISAARTNALTDRNTLGGEGSEEYNKNAVEYDAQKAEEALQGMQSYFPPVIGSRLVTNNAEPQPAVIPPAQPQMPMLRQTAPNSEAQKRMLDDYAFLSTRFQDLRGSGKIEYARTVEATASSMAQAQNADAVTGQVVVEAALPPAPVHSGQILYAIVDTGLNSDVPSTILATVAAGKLKNYKLIGGFQRFDERMVVNFNRLVHPASGAEWKIEGFAIDPATTEASVASNVNTHFFERWGSLVAASFLEGLGEARRFSGASSYGYAVDGVETSDTFAWGDYSPMDQAWIAAGKVGQRAGRLLERNFDRPPTVYLASGSEVGILIVSAPGTGN